MFVLVSEYGRACLSALGEGSKAIILYQISFVFVLNCGCGQLWLWSFVVVVNMSLCSRRMIKSNYFAPKLICVCSQLWLWSSLIVVNMSPCSNWRSKGTTWIPPQGGACHNVTTSQRHNVTTNSMQ